MEKADRISNSIRRLVVHLADVAQINETLRTLDAWEMGDEHDLLDVPRTVAVHAGIILGVKASALSWLIAVAVVLETRGIAVVSDREHLTKVDTRDHRPNVESSASRSLGQ